MKGEEQSTTVSITEIERLLEEGDQAWHRYHVQEALDAWQRGLERVNHVSEENVAARASLSCQLWSRVSEVWLARGLTSETIEAVENFERQAETCAGTQPELPVFTRIWRARVARRQRDMNQAQRLIHEALCMAEDLPPGETKQNILATVHLEQGITALELSENHTAMSALLQARSLYQQLDDRIGEAHSAIVTGRLYEWMSLHQQAITYYQEADDIIQDAPRSPTIEYVHQLGWGSALNNVERYLEAITHYQTALDLARRLGSEPYMARCLNNVGVTLQRQGEAEKALELYEEALELFRRLHDRYGIAVTKSNIGEIHLDLGNVDEALATLKEAHHMGEAINFRPVLPQNHYLLSAAYVLLDRPSKAFDHAEKALQLAEEIGNLTYAGIAYRALGIAAAALERQGRTPAVVPLEGPKAYFTASTEILAGMNQVYERARTLLAWGTYLRERHEPSLRAKGESYIRQAKEQFEQLQLPVPAIR